MRYYFFTGSPIGVESDGVVCGCVWVCVRVSMFLSVCLPVCVRVRVKSKSPKTSIYQRRVAEEQMLTGGGIKLVLAKPVVILYFELEQGVLSQLYVTNKVTCNLT